MARYKKKLEDDIRCPLEYGLAIFGGKSFDWGRVSLDYANYRDIYPSGFYQKILDLGLCKDGQKILDLGTGTGVLPRNISEK